MELQLLCQQCGVVDSPTHRKGVMHQRWADIQKMVAENWTRTRMAAALDVSNTRLLQILRQVHKVAAPSYRTKLSILLEYMEKGRWHEALKFAAKFPHLGEHKKQITRGASALIHPEFHRQLGKDPDALVAEGIAALRARYGKKAGK